MTRIRGSLALVTGAAHGIGRGLSLRLAERGATLILVDRDRAGLDAVAKEIQAAGGSVFPTVCDLSRRGNIETLHREVRGTHGPIDILCNNAGVVTGGPYLDVSADADQRMLDVNVAALHWMTKAFLPDLRASEGHLVQMASAAGYLGVPEMALYCASKWFVIGLSESIRLELRDQGAKVRITVVCPGFVDSGMFAGVKPPLLMPMLRVSEVVDAVIDAIENDKPVVRIPPLVRAAPILRALLPNPAFDRVSDWLGINRSMRTWRG